MAEILVSNDVEPPSGHGKAIGKLEKILSTYQTRAKKNANQWDDWHWQLAHRITNAAEISTLLHLSPQERLIMAKVSSEYHAAITPYYLSLINFEDPDDPIRKQAIPTPQEMAISGEVDPLNEEGDSPIPGLTHRYKDRALLITTNFCAVYCRHCTRKRLWRFGEQHKGMLEIRRMLKYIRSHEEIKDVIVSGGDPLTLPKKQLEFILKELRSIPHVEIIRIGTRIPVVLPQRITQDLVDMLDKYSPVWLNTQFNHPREVTPEAAWACERLLRAGIPVNNQSVLLRGINDNVEIMKELCRALLSIKVRPYYLFQCDPVIGADNFRTPVWKGMEIMEGLRGRMSGLGIPLYVVDGTGGRGKIPLLPNYLLSVSCNNVTLRNYAGEVFSYPNPQCGEEPCE
jgi:lysine 2,3-aminomutase